MRNVLFVTASLMGQNSKSREIGAEVVAAARGFGGAVVERALSPDSIPHLDMDVLGGLGKPAEIRTPQQANRVALADTLIAEVEAADTIVIATPMYNFSIPSTLKAWFDHIARAGRTFRYTAQGPEGLLKGKKVVVVASRGGFYTGDSPARGMDFQEPYLRMFLGFLGITDVTFIHVEGQAIGPEVAAKGLARARAQIVDMLPKAA
jgi:FMN-dependent NADH-azoreductase